MAYKGLDNSTAKDQGYPTSGQTQANQGSLPAQRAQQPYQQVKSAGGNGTLNGAAVQGSQYKVTAMPMSAGVASYASIPANPAQFTPPSQGQVMPGNQQPQVAFINKGPQFSSYQQEYGNPPAQPPASANPAPPTFGAKTGMLTGKIGPDGKPVAGAPPAPPAPPQWTPLADIEKQQHAFDAGSAYDIAARADLARKQADAARTMDLRNSLAGRGSNAGAMGLDEAWLGAQAGYGADRAKMEAGAQQQAFTNHMQYAQQVNQTKLQIAALASQLGMTMDDASYNQIAEEVLRENGGQMSVGSVLDKLNKSGQGAPTSQDRIKALSGYITSGDGNTIATAMEQLTPAEIKQIPAGWWVQALSEAWGDDNKRIQAIMIKNGIPIP